MGKTKVWPWRYFMFLVLQRKIKMYMYKPIHVPYMHVHVPVRTFTQKHKPAMKWHIVWTFPLCVYVHVWYMKTSIKHANCAYFCHLYTYVYVPLVNQSTQVQMYSAWWASPHSFVRDNQRFQWAMSFILEAYVLSAPACGWIQYFWELDLLSLSRIEANCWTGNARFEFLRSSADDMLKSPTWLVPRM